jgi:hypothetical protein
MSRPRRFGTGILWWFTVTGAVVPWLAGIGTKLYLDYHGQPTFSWSYFLGLEIVLVEIIFSLWFTSPFFLLGLHARRVLSSSAENPDEHRKRIIPIISGFIFGLIGEAIVFVAVFREFDILLLFTPLPLFYLFFIIVGWATGAGYVSLTGRRKTAN